MKFWLVYPLIFTCWASAYCDDPITEIQARLEAQAKAQAAAKEAAAKESADILNAIKAEKIAADKRSKDAEKEWNAKQKVIMEHTKALDSLIKTVADGVTPDPEPVAPKDVTLTLPPVVNGPTGHYITVTATTSGKEVRWVAFSDQLIVFPSQLLRDSRTTVVSSLKPGKYKLLAYSAVGDVPTNPVTCTVIVGEPSPDPNPDDVDPPGPEPPQPAPTGVRVIISYPAGSRDVDLINTIHSTALRDYLTKKCVKDGYRFWPDNIAIGKTEDKEIVSLYTDAMKTKKSKAAQILIAVNGKYEWFDFTPKVIDLLKTKLGE